MPFKKGQSGNPFGTPGEKVFRDLFRQVGAEVDGKTGKRKRRLLVEKVYALALKGEPWAAQCVLDRVDGKAAVEQTLTMVHQGEVRQLSDDELMAILVKQQAAVAATEKDETATLQ